MRLPSPLELANNSQSRRRRSRRKRDLLVVAALSVGLAACAATPTTATTVAVTAPPTPAVVLSPPTGAPPVETPVAAPSPTTATASRTLVFFTEAADNMGGAPRLVEFAQQQGWQLQIASAREAEARLSDNPLAVVSVSAELSASQWLVLTRQYLSIYFVLLAFPEAGAEIPANVLFVGGTGNREDQAGFLAGLIAGLATRSQRVAAFCEARTPTGLKYRYGFAAGVRYACPRCRLDLVDLTSTGDTAFAAAEGRKYALLGVDVIFAAAGEAGAAALAGAAEGGAWVIASDASPLPDSDRLLTRVALSPMPAFESALADFAAGKPRSGVEPLSLANGGVVLAPLRPGVLSPLDLQDLGAITQKLAEGTLETGVDPLTGEEK